MTQYYEGVGRRKTSTARARLTSGEGAVTCNDKPGQEYFTRQGDIDLVLEPLKAAGLAGKYDISLHVRGGGLTGHYYEGGSHAPCMGPVWIEDAGAVPIEECALQLREYLGVVIAVAAVLSLEALTGVGVEE